jgi:hypothetical protein
MVVEFHENANSAAIGHFETLNGSDFAERLTDIVRYAIAYPTEANLLTDFHDNCPSPTMFTKPQFIRVVDTSGNGLRHRFVLAY